MQRNGNINHIFSPELEHYACYIDLLARVGLVKEALEVVFSMPFVSLNIMRQLWDKIYSDIVTLIL
jgi:hypothetical protein